MIGAIAHQVRQRVLDQLQHLTVKFGLGTVHLEFDLLAEFGRKIAHDARQLLPGVADRLHARLHHAFLQLRGDIRQPLQRHLEVGILMTADDFEELIARKHKLGNRGHEMVEGLDMNADGMVPGPVAAFVIRLLGGRLLRCGVFWRELLARRLLHVLRQIEEIELTDQIVVVAVRLALLGFERFEDGLDPVDRGKNERDGLGRDRHAVAKFAHQAFGGVRQRLKPGQAEKAASALDGMDETKNVAEDFAVIRLLLEAHEFRVDTIETLDWSRSGTPAAGRPSRRLFSTRFCRPPLPRSGTPTRTLAARG